MADKIFFVDSELRHGFIGVEVKVRVVAEAAAAASNGFDCAADFAVKKIFPSIVRPSP